MFCFLRKRKRCYNKTKGFIQPLMQRLPCFAGLAWMVFGLVFLSGCSKTPVVNEGNAGRHVICFGDSITAGNGVAPGKDYPSFLRERTDWPVINAGNSGDTTRDALRRLERDVLSHDPYLVIVEFGANDFFKHMPLNETMRNVENIVCRIQEQGAIVAVVEVRIGLIRNEYAQGFRKITKKRGALFIPDIMKGISFDSKLKSDAIHPNARGYALISDRIYEKISPYL